MQRPARMGRALHQLRLLQQFSAAGFQGALSSQSKAVPLISFGGGVLFTEGSSEFDPRGR